MTDDTPVAVTTRAQAIKRFQEWATDYVKPGVLISEELIEERRKEAEEEFAE
jgi:hypothetical protein